MGGGIGREMLLELGLEATTSNDGREADEIFKQHPDIAFVLLDLPMPHRIYGGHWAHIDLKRLVLR